MGKRELISETFTETRLYETKYLVLKEDGVEIERIPAKETLIKTNSILIKKQKIIGG